jgi:nicotinamidase-related amidase
VKQIRGLSIPSGLEELCEPRRTALLVYDMQIGICSQIREGARIIERCAVALGAARRAGMRVVFTRHLSCPKNWMGTTQLRTAMAWQRTADPEAVKSWFLRGAPASEVVPELRPSADELVLDKLSMSAFEGTPLSYVLKDCDILGFAIVGIALEIGIEPTVRHATDLAELRGFGRFATVSH